LNVVFNTNVVLDVLLDREPFCKSAAQLFSYVESGTIAGYLCATTLTTVYYLSAKAAGRGTANEQVEKLLQLFDVTPVNRLVLEAALKLSGPDFEDAVLVASAHHAGMNSLVTRNPKDFKNSPVPVHTPDELLKILEDAEA
jgi:predicted nucleic acid-binding protein